MWWGLRVLMVVWCSVLVMEGAVVVVAMEGTAFMEGVVVIKGVVSCGVDGGNDGDGGCGGEGIYTLFIRCRM